MTCNKDCKNCRYGKLTPKTIICGDSNTTCNLNCTECRHAIIIEYFVNCGKN